jgi:hypothetical protein
MPNGSPISSQKSKISSLIACVMRCTGSPNENQQTKKLVPFGNTLEKCYNGFVAGLIHKNPELNCDLFE